MTRRQYAEVRPIRDDLTYFVTHPCQPPLFNNDTDVKKMNDWFGGVYASQHIVCALHGKAEAETRAEDNIKTVRLYYGAYESARSNRVLLLD